MNELVEKINDGEIVDDAKLNLNSPVQVKYEENEDWINAHFHSFSKDGRINVVPNGRTSFTSLVQGEDAKWHYSTYNFYRTVNEITDTGDARESDAYLEHWN